MPTPPPQLPDSWPERFMGPVAFPRSGWPSWRGASGSRTWPIVCTKLRSRAWRERLSRRAQQLDHIHLERIGKPLHHLERGIARRPFETADVGPVDAVLERELLLAEPALAAQPPQVCPQSVPRIHRPA